MPGKNKVWDHFFCRYLHTTDLPVVVDTFLKAAPDQQCFNCILDVQFFMRFVKNCASEACLEEVADSLVSSPIMSQNTSAQIVKEFIPYMHQTFYTMPLSPYPPLIFFHCQIILPKHNSFQSSSVGSGTKSGLSLIRKNPLSHFWTLLMTAIISAVLTTNIFISAYSLSSRSTTMIAP